MKITKNFPVIISLTREDGSRFEARIPKWKAYLIMSEVEREEFVKSKNDKMKK